MESQPLGRPPLIMSWEFRHHLHVNCLIAKPWLSRQAHHVRHLSNSEIHCLEKTLSRTSTCRNNKLLLTFPRRCGKKTWLACLSLRYSYTVMSVINFPLGHTRTFSQSCNNNYITENYKQLILYFAKKDRRLLYLNVSQEMELIILIRWWYCWSGPY